MAPPGEGARPARLPEMQEPLLEYAAPASDAEALGHQRQAAPCKNAQAPRSYVRTIRVSIV